MARGKRRRRPASGEPRDVTRLAHGGARLETRRGSDWYVREIPASRSEKAYVCPGCALDILPGQAHLVIWSAEHLFGDDAAIRERRHWHTHCWRVF
ncbi:ATP/GTP-binding protein [Leucobacter weissii]|uniref:ATP/GTP-binding protein n=1 Tax=Leucobacter weissii TaxID=1983706 RepID=A0A939SBA0_9MICO|nr:ATP/GTP-binding protein [Leucobacter weissii]MBO1901183.1 ATP/GTP-binding protein [Leucobacter weissii]